MAKNSNLHAAKSAKNDEFYTQLTDIEKEMVHYKDHFRGKTIYCNCDDPAWSNFWRYFHLNFEFLGLKKLISTHYDPENPTYKLEYMGGNDANIEAGVRTKLLQNGDFRSEECVEVLKECDIVVTNCPFSLFRAFIAQLMKYEKKFVIIGNMNAITYKEVFPLLKADRVWLGYNSPKDFITPGGTLQKFGNMLWFTNLDHDKRHEPLRLHKKYFDDPGLFLHYDNFNAINSNRVSDIPMDYDGIIGVPVSFIGKYCPEQFEILGLTCRRYSPEYCTKVYKVDEYERANDYNGSACVRTGGEIKMIYCRLLIRRRN